MEANKKTLKIGLVLISLCLILSIVFSMIIKLREPVFLMSYIDNEVYFNDGRYSDTELILNYITNVNDDRYVTDISFLEAPREMDIMASDYSFGITFPNFTQGNRENIYGRYKVKTVYVKFDLNKMDSEIENLELNNAKIFFDNGDNLDVNIGRVIFYKYQKNDEIFGSSGSGSSSDGSGYIEHDIKKHITLINIESTLLENLSEIVAFKVEDKDYREVENIEYKNGSKIRMTYNLNPSSDTKPEYMAYNVSPKLIFKDDNGNIIEKRIRDIRNDYYNFNFARIFKYLRARGEI